MFGQQWRCLSAEGRGFAARMSPARQALRDSAWLPRAEAREEGALPEMHTHSQPVCQRYLSAPWVQSSRDVCFSLSPKAVSHVTKGRGHGEVTAWLDYGSGAAIGRGEPEREAAGLLLPGAAPEGGG